MPPTSSTARSQRRSAGERVFRLREAVRAGSLSPAVTFFETAAVLCRIIYPLPLAIALHLEESSTKERYRHFSPRNDPPHRRDRSQDPARASGGCVAVGGRDRGTRRAFLHAVLEARPAHGAGRDYHRQG